MSSDPTEAEVQEIAVWIYSIKKRYHYKRNQLLQALGREPTSQELMEVAGQEIDILSKLHDAHREAAWKRKCINLPFGFYYPALLPHLLADVRVRP